MINCISNISLVILLMLLFGGCQGDDMSFSDPSEVISALPENVLYPTDNPFSQEKEDLGRLLYWDPILSGGKDVACVTCHHPNLGYADGLDLSQGVGASGLGQNRSGGLKTKRNAPTV